MQKTNITCLGFIMDGNRRWAKEKSLPTLAGHKKGGDVLFSSIDWVKEVQIPHAVYYAFSTENWKRSEEEVNYLMELFQKTLLRLREKFGKGRKKEDGSAVNVRFIGNRSDFSEAIQVLMNEIETGNIDSSAVVTTVWIALSYGGRAEIVEAVNTAVAEGKEVTEESFESLLQTAEMPDPDMIVRTSGEHRLSNFLTWKSVYSELFFINKHWPALTKDDFKDILTEYESRDRRKGA